MQKTLIVAGGGTGGHIFPGIAVAKAWQDLGGKVIWAGSNLGKEKIYVPDHDIDLKIIKMSPVKGKGLFQKLKTIFQIPGAILKAMKIIKVIQPDVVLGVGGYASFAMTLAAFLKRIPIAIAEQNAFAGLTNRILGKFAKVIFLSFEDEYQQFSSKKTRVVGNAIRATIKRQDYPKTLKPFCIFITGGSLGAVSVNQKIRDALTILKPHWSDFKIIHQVGENDFEASKQFYENATNLKVTYQKFFKDMHSCYKEAHLIICRAGASTATEIALSGKPAIFIPYPYAADDHQTKNANYYVKRKAALMIPQKNLEAKKLAEQILHFKNQPEELLMMANNMKKAAKPDAATKIANHLLELVS